MLHNCPGKRWSSLLADATWALNHWAIRYDLTKKALLKTPYFQDNALTHVTSAVCAGTVAVTICAPIDVMKSRMQSTAARETVSRFYR